MRFPDTLCHVHACQVPLLVWLLSFAGATFASAFYLTVEGLFNFAGLSTFSFVAMNLFWGYFRPSHPLAKKCTQFLKLRADTTASACGRGPTRALQAQELQDFRDFFQSFIKARVGQFRNDSLPQTRICLLLSLSKHCLGTWNEDNLWKQEPNLFCIQTLLDQGRS